MPAPLIRRAERKKAKMRVAVLGPSGSGKTFSSLLLARGLASSWEKVGLIDSENGSGDLYSDLGPYNVITLNKFSPRDYIEAIEAMEQAGMEAIVVDSASHEWEWCKAEADRIAAASKSGNSYTAWGPVGKLHDEFLRKLNTASVHMVECARTKQDYVLVDKNGKKVPEKVGMAAVQRDGFEYEFTVVLELDMAHKAYATKDRTRIFEGKEAEIITQLTGVELLKWSVSGADVLPEKQEDTFDKPDWDQDKPAKKKEPALKSVQDTLADIIAQEQKEGLKASKAQHDKLLEHWNDPKLPENNRKNRTPEILNSVCKSKGLSETVDQLTPTGIENLISEVIERNISYLPKE